MMRGVAPGAQARGSPLSWMEGERGEDRGSGAEAGGRDVAPGAPATRAPPGSDTALRGPARGAWAPRSTACAPSLCLRLAGNRASAAPSPGRRQRWPAVQASCSRPPLTPRPRPPSWPELVRVPLGRCPGRVNVSRELASGARVGPGQPRGPAACHTLARGLQPRVSAPTCRSTRSAGRGPWTPS